MPVCRRNATCWGGDMVLTLSLVWLESLPTKISNPFSWQCLSRWAECNSPWIGDASFLKFRNVRDGARDGSDSQTLKYAFRLVTVGPPSVFIQYVRHGLPSVLAMAVSTSEAWKMDRFLGLVKLSSGAEGQWNGDHLDSNRPPFRNGRPGLSPMPRRFWETFQLF